MLSRLARSKKTNPAFTERQNAEHARRMADIQAGIDAMTSQHIANMQAIQGSAERHQARMNAITAAGDANTAAFENRMDAIDGNQRQFLNYINDEQTVVDGGGKAFQVDDGYDRYFVNKSDNSYVRRGHQLRRPHHPCHGPGPERLRRGQGQAVKPLFMRNLASALSSRSG